MCACRSVHHPRGRRAIAVGLDYSGVGNQLATFEWEKKRDANMIGSGRNSREFGHEFLIELPSTSDPWCPSRRSMLLSKIGPPAFFTDANLLALVSFAARSISASRVATVRFVHRLRIVVHETCGPCSATIGEPYIASGQGYDLVEQRGLTRFQARTYMNFGNGVVPRTRHVLAGRDLVRLAFEAASKAVTSTRCCLLRLQPNEREFLPMAGDPLAEAEREASVVSRCAEGAVWVCR